MEDGVLDVFDRLDGNVEREELLVEVIVRRRGDLVWVGLLEGRVQRFKELWRHVERDLGVEQTLEDGCQGTTVEVGVDEEGFDGVAAGRVVCLRVDDDPGRLGDVEVLVEVDGADAVGVAKDRDLCVFLDVPHERVGASWDDKVDVPVLL